MGMLLLISINSVYATSYSISFQGDTYNYGECVSTAGGTGPECSSLNPNSYGGGYDSCVAFGCSAICPGTAQCGGLSYGSPCFGYPGSAIGCTGLWEGSGDCNDLDTYGPSGQCETNAGCSGSHGSCTGTYDCTYLDYYTDWSSFCYGFTCVGSSSSACQSNYDSGYTCSDLPGCNSYPYCTGTANPCSSFDGGYCNGPPQVNNYCTFDWCKKPQDVAESSLNWMIPYYNHYDNAYVGSDAYCTDITENFNNPNGKLLLVNSIMGFQNGANEYAYSTAGAFIRLLGNITVDKIIKQGNTLPSSADYTVKLLTKIGDGNFIRIKGQ